MSFLSRVELKKQLQNLGVKVEGNYVRKSDIKKCLADASVANKAEWSKPDHNGVIEMSIGKLSAYVAPLNNEFEWDISDAETGENIDAGTESTIKKAKQRAAVKIREMMRKEGKEKDADIVFLQLTK